MAFLIVRHVVEDYETWKPHYDAHGSVRKKFGCTGEQLFRTTENPDDLFLLFEWDTVENARKFVQTSDVKEVMAKSGVVGIPEIHYLEKIESIASGVLKNAA